MRGIEWLKSFGASEHWIIGAWELETLVAWIVGTLGPLDSESNYKSPFESPFERPSKVCKWLWRGNEGG